MAKRTSKAKAPEVVDEPMSDAESPEEDLESEEPNGDFQDFGSDEELSEDDEGEGVIEIPEDLQDIDDEEDEDEDDDDAVSDISMDGGIALPNGREISPSAIRFTSTAVDTDNALSSAISTDAASTAAAGALLHPEKPTPFVPDAGHLLITDPNPLILPPKTSNAAVEAELSASARDSAQALLNHLLTTCPIHSVPVTATSASGVTMTLPPPTYLLPREKKIPTPKPPTKWEQFAARKGIGKNKKGGVGRGGANANGDLRSTEGKKVYDEATGEWVNKWGYKGRNKKGEGDWLVEIDEKKEAKSGEPADPRGASRAARKERVKRNERMQRANERRSRKPGA